MRKTVILILLVLLITSLMDCHNQFNPNGTEIGFGYDYQQRPLMAAVKSNQKEFNINDSTLDFYYGWNDGTFEIRDGKMDFGYDWDDGILVGVGLYFIDYDGYKMHEFSNFEFKNYAERPHANFIKIIPIEEFGTEKYQVNNTRRGGKKLNHVESITIPKEYLKTFSEYGKRGRIVFTLNFIIYYPEREIYLSGWGGELILRYEYLSSEIIKIFSSTGSYN